MFIPPGARTPRRDRTRAFHAHAGRVGDPEAVAVSPLGWERPVSVLSHVG